MKGITVFKLFIWGSIPSDIRSGILFNGDASADIRIYVLSKMDFSDIKLIN